MRTLLPMLLVGCSQDPSVAETRPSGTEVVGDTKLQPVTGTTDTGPSSTPWSCDAIAAAEEEGEPLYDASTLGGPLDACTERLHALIMPTETRFRLTLTQWTGDSAARLELRDWNGSMLESGEGLDSGDSVLIDAAFGGEHALWVGSVDGQPADYVLDVRCEEGCDRVTTRYPVVLLHGMAGDTELFDLVEYFYEVDETLIAQGHTVYVAAVDPFQPTPVRAARWREHLDGWLATGEARRVNLVGHSQGGLDARHLATHLDPDAQIRSITTIATPHRGSLVADLAWGLIDDLGFAQSLVDAAFDGLASFYGLSSDQDINGQLLQLTTSASAQFNADTRDRDDVAYYSWAGTTCQLLDLFCQGDHGGEIVDPLLSATHAVMLVLEGSNDGLVSVSSSEWGEFRGVLDADHLDEVGLLPGTTAPGFDHKQFFLDEAEWLAEQGL